MSNASDDNLKYTNRYGFHINMPNEKAGVASEYVHQEVLRPIEDLHQKTNRALSLRPDDADYQAAVKLLAKCMQDVQNGLEHTNAKLPQSEPNELEESVNTPHRSFGF
ncbi:hypothetical protein [Legionella worsleiensis]|uniref:Uncharacterized protein n=1 Tax=Legionella worsleiensis TaxID=45076 RepID=Q49JB8_9GAMM|nr:hypothetical protein [Legionella worsleiensis]AAX56158.1 unknown [Legionella worsleiensis]KTD81712.1 hypothetical protein Lwor_0494 [Legionella worsleiensis]STY31878.1 Uncharacterised protein [Legionella worsleiensis]